MPAREKAIHLGAFEHWYTSERSCPKTAAHVRVSERHVRRWAEEFHWHARADARDQEAAKQAERAAIQARSRKLQEHQKLGELMRRRATEHFVKREIDNTADAIRAAKEGIAIERTAEGLPSFIAELFTLNDDELTAERQRLLRRLSAGPDRPDSFGTGEAATGSEDTRLADGDSVLSADADG